MAALRFSLLLLLASVGFVASSQHRHLLDTCGEGQEPNSKGVCTTCKEGYVRTSASPLVCSKCPCVSLGSCQVNPTTSEAFCMCPQSYHGVTTAAGTLCQQCPGYNSTSRAECGGHGTCLFNDPVGTSPACSCAPGWTGIDCSQCALGHTGADCQQCATGFVSVNGECAGCPGYCSGGQGTCQIVGGNATCQCGTGWSGSQCERPDTANGYFLVYDGNGDLVNGTVSNGPQYCSVAADCGFNAACVDGFCQCSAGFTTAGAWYHAGSVGIKCSACPLGSYRGDVSTLPCTSCPYDRSTTATPGAISADQCIACSNDQMVCASGTTFDPATCLCEAGSASTAGLNVGSKVAIGLLVPVGFLLLLGAGSVYVVRMRQERLQRQGSIPPGAPAPEGHAAASAPPALAAAMSDAERRENDSM
ncbi:hypothetical protein KFL_005920070 [Klebsormidium nitens]|uniref:EGF-like domain-containing protein n=1 Tax=Klebsormidium nitens TaxID=105231 RepID=A0A1Y1IH92_KLENI|nr:hypothetical protein KFL_005920070 [Klebsormidium nitens]|eukprot:GAQ90043.1 hypothetical protein KFL_005920070 [Klebsormidium nitens]